MANTVFYFYYSPSWDWPPDGPIKLGNVLTSIKKPEQPLYTAPLPIDSEIYSSEKLEVKYSTEKARDGKFSILAKPLSILGLGVDIGAEWEKRNQPTSMRGVALQYSTADEEPSNQETFTFDRVETKQFIPKDAYIEKCIGAEAVRRYLDRSRYRKPVYLITGIKVVYGAKAESSTSRTRGGMAGVAVDGTVWSGGTVPIAIEPGTEAKVERKQGTSWQGSTDFIFAFRVRKIRVNKKTKAVTDHDDYLKGTMLGDKDRKIQQDFPELELQSQEESQAADEGYDEELLMEGDTVIHCAVQNGEDSDEE